MGIEFDRFQSINPLSVTKVDENIIRISNSDFNTRVSKSQLKPGTVYQIYNQQGRWSSPNYYDIFVLANSNNSTFMDAKAGPSTYSTSSVSYFNGVEKYWKLKYDSSTSEITYLKDHNNNSYPGDFKNKIILF